MTDGVTGEKVIKNTRSAGTERYIKISGQDFWTGINHNLRSKIGKELKKYFYNILSEMKPVPEDEYPIGVKIDIYDVIDEGDIDNLIYIYRKTVHDSLCGNIEFVKDENGKFHPDRKNYKPLIIDDSKEYIQEINTRFYPIRDHEERQMIIQLYRL